MPDSHFDWIEYLKLAQELATRTEESFLRTSLSRAYYYVFHLAMDRATKNGFTLIRGEASHYQLWRLYNSNPEPQCVKLAQIAQRLKEKRERADYNPSYYRISEDLPSVLADAQDFANRLNSLDARHPNPASVRQ